MDTLTNLTYQLRDSGGTSAQFYADLRAFTLKVLAYPDTSLTGLADEMYLLSEHRRKGRSREEYLFELLMLGIFWINYRDTVVATGTFKLHLLKGLHAIRRNCRVLKTPVDRVRGLLMSALQPSTGIMSDILLNRSTHSRLILFLQASGDYREEASRLREWRSLLNESERGGIDEVWRDVEHFAIWFSEQAARTLGQYTSNVPEFIAGNGHFYRKREDKLLCLRNENEYHLNMVGAQIMNKILRPDFRVTKRKVVLLPTCMREVGDSECNAIYHDLVRECIACRPECHIGKVKLSLKDPRHSVFLIPHSSDFSRFLRKWKGDYDTALIGVACVPNLIMGGYEMQSLGLRSQCVFLDYCGCKKHWSPAKPVTTDLDHHQLHEILKDK
jgi:hypothetical protein